jgi:hypothetical protein
VSVTYQRLPELSTEERQYHVQDQIEFAGIAHGGDRISSREEGVAVIGHSPPSNFSNPLSGII